METTKFLFNKNHFDTAANKFKNPKHKEWIATYFPFNEIELELPPPGTSAFNGRKWLDPIWDEYVSLCDSLNDNYELNEWHKGFYEFFGEVDFEFLGKIEEVLKELNAFPQSTSSQVLQRKKNHHPTQRRLTDKERNELEESIEQLLGSKEDSPQGIKPSPEESKQKVENELGWVYLIKVKDRFKIGRSSQFLIRMKTLKPTKIIYEVMCKNYIALEEEIHSIFNDYRYQGSEIFDLNEEQIIEVKLLMKDKALL